LVTPCVGNAFLNMLLKEINKGREVEQENVRSYQTTLRKRKKTYIYYNFKEKAFDRTL